MLLFLAINWAWYLHQLDVSNAFLYHEIGKQIFMEQSLGYVSQGE